MVKLKQLWISRKYLWADLNTNELVVWQRQDGKTGRSSGAESQPGRGLSYLYASCPGPSPPFKPPAEQTFQNAVEGEIDIFPLISVFYFYHGTYRSVWIPCRKTHLAPEWKNHLTQTCNLNDHCIKRDSFHFLSRVPLQEPPRSLSLQVPLPQLEQVSGVQSEVIYLKVSPVPAWLQKILQLPLG